MKRDQLYPKFKKKNRLEWRMSLKGYAILFLWQYIQLFLTEVMRTLVRWVEGLIDHVHGEYL